MTLRHFLASVSESEVEKFKSSDAQDREWG